MRPRDFVTDVVTVVTAVVVGQEGKVLMQKRGPTRELPGQWEYPGGKVEGNEDHFQALHRELNEELGLTPIWIADEPFLMAKIGPPTIERETKLYAYVVRVHGDPIIREDQQEAGYYSVGWAALQQTAFSRLITAYLQLK